MPDASPERDKGPRGSPFPTSAGFDQSGEEPSAASPRCGIGEKGGCPARRDGAEIGNMGGRASEDSSPPALLEAPSREARSCRSPTPGRGLSLCRGRPPTSSRRAPHPSGSECLFLAVHSASWHARSSGREEAPDDVMFLPKGAGTTRCPPRMARRPGACVRLKMARGVWVRNPNLAAGLAFQGPPVARLVLTIPREGECGVSV